MSQIAVNVRKATAADAYIPLDMAEHQRRLRGHIKVKGVRYSLWLTTAIAEAHSAKIPLAAMLNGDRHWAAVLARWRAWKQILDKDPDYSIKSLATACGYDHTTILYGLKRLAEGCCERDKPTAMPPNRPAKPINVIPILVPKR